jgi:hypothetical protein
MTYQMPEARVGQNYVAGYRPLREISADIRKAIATAKTLGQIPADIKVSVRVRDGLAIDVKLSGWDRDQLIEAPENSWDYARSTAAATAVRNRVEAIRESFNRDASDPMVDYYEVTYYGSTSLVVPN